MDVQEIQRIGAEAAAEENQEQAAQAELMQAAAPQQGPGLADELAEFLNLAASVAGVATGLPVAQRFTPEANINISAAAIKLCDRYGWDARKVLIGQDSALGVWLGLGVAVAMPSLGVWSDYKGMKAAQAAAIKAANDAGGADDGQQASAG